LIDVDAVECACSAIAADEAMRGRAARVSQQKEA
jgi:hypothetical protein